MKLLFASAILLASLGCTRTEPHKNREALTLWYQQPAATWNEALPVGNGRIGAMIFGGTETDRIQLNDDSLWPADLGWDEPEGTPEDLQQIRNLLITGEQEEADAMFVDKFSRKTVVRSHQTLGDLILKYDSGEVRNYRRALNLDEAVATTTYEKDGGRIKQTVFASHPHHCIIVQIESDVPQNMEVSLSRPLDAGVETVQVHTKEDRLVMNGEVTQRDGMFNSQPAPITSGVKFQTIVSATHDGSLELNAQSLKINGARNVVLYLVNNSSYYHANYESENEKQLSNIQNLPLHDIKDAHIADHQLYFNRVWLKAGDTGLDSIPTDVRLARVKEGATDTGLEAMLFQYGRYLLIGSSRPGTNPANLQGLWNEHIKAPWNADYHLNINLQMNYWLADGTNLSELNDPLFDYIDRLIENGKVTARTNYGCSGAFIPHATDLWAPTWLRAPTAYWGCSVGAGGWLAQHYWHHFEYSADTSFLRNRAFPAQTEIAKFYSDWLMVDPRDSTLISAPSTSPENRYINEKGNSVATCLGSAMDQQVIHEVFTNYLKGAKVLGVQDPFTEKVKNQLSMLRPGFVVGDDGRLLEWDREYEEPEPGHRHMSHLYGFHPGDQVSSASSPELFKAVRKTLDYRLDNGGAGTGWSRAWLINCSARLRDPAMVQEHIQLMLQKSIQDNMFDSHPPFQIDGNFGFTAGITEMLLQSYEKNIIRVLPALPPHWIEGSVTGLKARGNVQVDISWKNNQLHSMQLSSPLPQTFVVVYNDTQEEISLFPDQPFTWKATE